MFSGGGGIGLTGLAFGPFGLLAARTRVLPRILAILGLFLITSWFLTLQESRYLIPAYPIAAVFAALGWRHIQTERPRFSGLLCGTVIACSLLYGLFMIGANRWSDLRRFFSSPFAAEQREERIPFLRSFEYLNAEPSVKRVLVLDRSVPVYYLDKSYLKPFGQWREQVLPESRNAEQVLGEIGGLQISHILDVHSGISDYQVPE